MKRCLLVLALLCAAVGSLEAYWQTQPPATASLNQSITVCAVTSSSDYNTILIVWAQTPSGAWRHWPAGGGAGPAIGSPYSFTLDASGTWTIYATTISPANNPPAGSSPSGNVITSVNTTTVGPTPVTFSFGNLSHTYDGGTKTATVTPSIGGATYNAAVICGPGAGYYTVSATATGGYSGSGSATLTISPAGQSTVSISPATPTVAVGTSITFTASGGGVGGYNWAGSASGSGGSKTLSFVTPGTYHVYAQSPGDGANYYPSNVADDVVTVTKASQSITFAQPSGQVYNVPAVLSASASSGLPVSWSIVSGPATVSFGTVQFTGTGNVTVRVSQAGDGSYYAAPDVDRTFAVSPGNQTITFSQPAAQTYGTSLTLGATASSNLPVSYSIVSGPATVAGNVVSFAGTGTVTVRAAQSGNANWNAASTVDRSFAVNAAGQTITFSQPVTQTYGTPLTLAATASSGLAVSYSIVSGPATVAGSVVSFTGTGSVTVRASQAGNANYTAATAVDRSFAVNAAAQAITFNQPATQTYGTPLTLAATASSGLAVSYSIVSGPATVAGSVVSFTGTGNVTVRATQVGNANYAAAATVDRTFAVNAAGQTITFPAQSSQTYGGSTLTLNATASSGLAVTYSVYSGPATVGGSVVTFTGAGTVVIRAAQAGNANYNAAANVDGSIAVNKAGQTVTFAQPAAQTYGTALTLAATASSGLGVTYSIVSGPGTLAGNVLNFAADGSVVVRASQAGNANYNAASDIDRTVTVAKRAITVTLAGSKLFSGTTAPTGASASITAGSAAAGDTIGYVFANTTSELPGTYTGLTTASLTNATAPTNRTSSYTITYAGSYLIQQNQIAQATVTATAATTLPYGGPYSVSASGGSGTGAYEWALGTGSTASNAAIDTAGNISLRSTGTIVVKARRLADFNYLVSNWSADLTITITARPITVTLAGTKTYDGSTTGTNATLTVTTGTLAAGDSLATYVAPNANAGTYALTEVTIVNTAAPTNRTANYALTYAGNYSITRRSITAATIAPLTYNGAAQFPAAVSSVTPAGATVTVSSTAAQTNAAIYSTGTVTGTGNYQATLSGLSWTIAPATPSGTFTARRLGTQNPSAYTVQAAEFNAAFTGVGGAAVGGTIAYAIAPGSPMGVAGTTVSAGATWAVGDYKIRATLTPTSSNYAAASVDAIWTVTLDTDLDGVPDYIELQIGTDPKVFNSPETNPANPTGLKIQRSNP